MPTIENYSEHHYSFPRGPIAEKALTIPRGGTPRGQETGGFKPGTLNVTESDLGDMLAGPVSRSWFNRDNLVVKDVSPGDLTKLQEAAQKRRAEADAKATQAKA